MVLYLDLFLTPLLFTPYTQCSPLKLGLGAVCLFFPFQMLYLQGPFLLIHHINSGMFNKVGTVAWIYRENF